MTRSLCVTLAATVAYSWLLAPSTVAQAPVDGVGVKKDEERRAVLPEDFAFMGMTKADREIDVIRVAKTFSLYVEDNGSRVKLSSERDSVQGLHGKGLDIEQKNEGNRPSSR